MPRLLLINSVYGKGSTGKIVKDLCNVAEKNQFSTYVVYGRDKQNETKNCKYIGDKLDFYVHVLLARLFDIQGLLSFLPTRKLIKFIKIYKPDLINFHNIHGYYLNYRLLFRYLSKVNVPIVLTLHDSWIYTGHCSYYLYSKCNKWKEDCSHCPNRTSYPKTVFFSNSKRNHKIKKEVLLNIQRLYIITPSKWLKNELCNSFLSNIPCNVINNGIDLNVFYPRTTVNLNKIMILGVANVWEKRKGFEDFLTLASMLDSSFQIVLIGLNGKQINKLPSNIIGIQRTYDQNELAEYYSKALVFINPTYEDNFPTTNIEALACGTPVITYNTGGSPEAIDENTGFIVEQGDVKKIYNCIEEIRKNGKSYYSEKCVERAKKMYDKDKKYQEYIDIYKSILN